MKETLVALVGGRVPIEETDIETSDELRRRYVLHIPVLLYAGEELARHRASREELRLALGRVGIL